MRMPAGWQLVRGWLLRWAGAAVALVMIVASLAVVAMWRTQHIRVLSVQSNSMAPVLQKGDAVLAWPVAPQDIAVGDLVSHPDSNGMIVTHRVVQVDAAAGRLVTKGDANTVPDPPADMSQVVGSVRYAVPGLGYVVDALYSWPGLVAAVYLPAAVVLLREFRRLAAHYLRPTYVLPR